ncbi:MAG TPA: hypothetical protein VIS48_10800 [Candidatus Kryptonia bacterium]
MGKALVVKPKTKSDMKFLSDLLQKLGIKSSIIDEEAIEDAGLSALMKEADRTRKVSRKSVMKKLKS